MDSDKYTTVQQAAAPHSPLEVALTAIHGDLHQVIPQLCAERGQPDTARALTTDTLKVSNSWINRWLKVNGYERVVTYVRKAEASA